MSGHKKWGEIKHKGTPEQRAGARTESIYERVREILEVAEEALDWTVNPKSDAPPCVMVGEVVDRLQDLELDLRCEVLAGDRGDTE